MERVGIETDKRGRLYMPLAEVHDRDSLLAALEPVFGGKPHIIFHVQGIGDCWAWVRVGLTVYRVDYDEDYGSGELYGPKTKLRKIARRLATES